MTEKAHYQVGLIGPNGYTGQALAALLRAHPRVTLAATFGRDTIKQLDQHLDTLDFLFLATPTEVSLDVLVKLKDCPIPIIDLSGGLRLPADVFENWYHMAHPNPSLIETAVYGLQPWNNTAIQQQPTRIANPGCYATCALMALMPLLQQQCIDPNSIIIDAKSGISGAGRSAKTELLFCELNQNFIPYKVGQHQHTPEIEHYLKQITGVDNSVLLTTQLLPVTRGISMTIYTDIKTDVTTVTDAYGKAYSNNPFVKFAELTHNRQQDDKLIGLQSVVNTPNTHIGYTQQNNRLVIFASIDNLLKGAASQAIENFNTYYDLPLTLGLTQEHMA